jgi:hypothetical protein
MRTYCGGGVHGSCGSKVSTMSAKGRLRLASSSTGMAFVMTRAANERSSLSQ